MLSSNMWTRLKASEKRQVATNKPSVYQSSYSGSDLYRPKQICIKSVFNEVGMGVPKKH